ncbi:GLPGLI family protein [Paenimyroides aestuarii]|uniref:GLPGLI family protein n=1 Tax=Paenimyroides aestuarii TaxID=2968490 RepID=A0ABY5NT71_9FLAO|nr:GLPGLI family protein [Paenimyroides aestuarii]UUV21735.1 GLPGLI family protein [Paenimyroides aestuarii]
MKTKFLYLLFFTSVCFAQKTTGVVTYEITIGDDPRALLREIDKQTLRNAQKLASEIEFNLYFTSTESYFEISSLPIDYNYFSDLFIESSTQPEYSVYCNLTNKEYTYSFYYEFKSEHYLLKDKANYNWNITAESKSIDNFTVYKAVGTTPDEQKIEAWFAPEIPVAAGPEIYMNLPGLILELQIGYTMYAAKKIEFTNNYTQKIAPITKGKQINEADFLRITNEEVEYYRK